MKGSYQDGVNTHSCTQEAMTPEERVLAHLSTELQDDGGEVIDGGGHDLLAGLRRANEECQVDLALHEGGTSVAVAKRGSTMVARRLHREAFERVCISCVCA